MAGTAEASTEAEVHGATTSQRKLEERARRAVRAAVARLSHQQQLEALGQPSDYAALIEALLAADVPAAHDDQLARARLRGLEAKHRLLSEAGGCLSAKELAENLQVSRQALEKRRKAGQLLAVKVPGSRTWRYPQWQFAEDSALLTGLPEVLEELDRDDPWAALVFFLRTQTGAGRTPLAALQAGSMDEALRAARAYGEQGAL